MFSPHLQPPPCDNEQASASRAAMRAYGNTAGPAVLTVLERLWDTVTATPASTP